jgi:hypothetical protein
MLPMPNLPLVYELPFTPIGSGNEKTLNIIAPNKNRLDPRRKRFF